jgi:NADH-quinone oxidoreductase subunit M
MLLSWMVFLPLLYALVVGLAMPKSWIKPSALILSLLHFLWAIPLLHDFDPSTSALQFTEKYSWVSALNIEYFVGVDGLSLWLVILTLFLQPIVVLASWKSVEERVAGYFAALFVLQSAMLGTFVSLDAFLFYAFWEMSLIPMYFLIGIWGGARRLLATVKFFIYTMAGSVLMLVAMVTLMLMHKEVTGVYSSNILDWYQIQIPFVADQLFSPQTLLFIAFVLAFAIKTPAFPVHTWLPDAHVEAPTAGSVILAGVMLKMGTYGFVRWVIPLFPEASQYWGWILVALGVVGIVYGAMMAFVQTDIKKLIAYSSVSHMGYVLAGLFTFNAQGLTGAIYQMLNHGISTGALFLLIGMIYERTHTREMEKYGGVARFMPWFTIAFVIVTLSSIAVPMTNGFVGEFLILLGIFKYHKVYAAISVLGVVLGAVYMLWLVKKVFYGPAGTVTQDAGHPLVDLQAREWLVILPFIVLIFVMGLYPEWILQYMKVSISHLVENFTSYQLLAK